MLEVKEMGSQRGIVTSPKKLEDHIGIWYEREDINQMRGYLLRRLADMFKE